MMLSHDLALTVIIFTWSERWELRVTPRILGLYGKGDGAPPPLTGRHPGEGGTGWSREVKRVAWDFARDTLRQLSLAQRATLDAFSVSRLADSGTEGEAATAVKSSA